MHSSLILANNLQCSSLHLIIVIQSLEHHRSPVHSGEQIKRRNFLRDSNLSWKTFACFKLGSLEKQILPRDLYKRGLLGSILSLGGSGELRTSELWRGENWSPMWSQEAPADPWGPRWPFSVVLPWDYEFSVLCPPEQAVSWKEAQPWQNSSGHQPPAVQQIRKRMSTSVLKRAVGTRTFVTLLSSDLAWPTGLRQCWLP